MGCPGVIEVVVRLSRVQSRELLESMTEGELVSAALRAVAKQVDGKKHFGIVAIYTASAGGQPGYFRVADVEPSAGPFFDTPGVWPHE